MLISVTRLKIRHWFFLPVFFFHNFRITKQLKKTPGFVGGRLLVDRKMTFWTMSAWKDEKSMMQFRNSGPHVVSMPRLRKWCSEAHVHRWEMAGSEMPSWAEAHRQIASQGKASKVDHPAEAQTSRNFPEPRVSPNFDQLLKPSP